MQSQTTLGNNDCKSAKYNLKFILDTNAEARAYAAMDKLGDAEGNFHFWHGLFKKSLEPKSKVKEHQIWAVISDAKDASARGVVKSSVVQYAIKALIRAGVVQPAAQRVIFESKLETIQVSS